MRPATSESTRRGQGLLRGARANSTEEAIRLTQEFNVHFVKEPQHFLVADSSGDSRVVEFIDGAIRITPAESRWQVCTNHCLWNRSEADNDGECDRYQSGSEAAENLPANISSAQAKSAIRSMYVDDWMMWTSTYNLTSGDISVTWRSATDSTWYGQIPRRSTESQRPGQSPAIAGTQSSSAVGSE